MPDNYNMESKGEFIELIKKHIPSVIGINKCPHAAVCIPLIFTMNGIEILFEKRSSNIPEQPGDICFPGGMIEDNETPAQAAVRETSEELLISEENIILIGASDYIHMENLAVYPFVAEIKNYKGTFSMDEVNEIFTVPLSWFQENPPESYIADSIIVPKDNFPYDRIVNGRKYRWRSRSENIYFYQYGKNTIWGLTAKILKSFLKICYPL